MTMVYSACNRTFISHPLAQRPLWERRSGACKSLTLWRVAGKQHFLDMSIACTHNGYEWIPVQDQISSDSIIKKGCNQNRKVLSLAEELLSSGKWDLGSCPCSSGWLYTHLHGDSTHWTRWVKNNKRPNKVGRVHGVLGGVQEEDGVSMIKTHWTHAWQSQRVN